MSTEDFKLKEKVEAILRKEGLGYESKPQANDFFSFQVKFYDGLFFISELINKRGSITIEGAFALTKDQKTLITENFDADQLTEFLWNIRSFLLQRETLFRIKDNFADLPWIVVQRIIYEEELSLSRLMKDMREMALTLYGISWLIDKNTGSPRPRAENPAFYK